MNIYVGNLSPKTSEWQLRKAFERYGKVGKISMDTNPVEKATYRFCFVEMPFDNQASVAIKELNGKNLGSSPLTVVESGVTV